MRIAVVTSYFPNSSAPFEGNSSYQTLRLLAERHVIRVFVPETRYPAFIPASRRKAPLDPKWQAPDVESRYIPFPALPVVTRPLNGLLAARKLLPAVREFAPEIILNYMVYPNGYTAVLLGKKLHLPVVVTATGSDLNRIPDRLVRRLTMETLRRADFVQTRSHDLAQTAVRLGSDPKRTRAILNGCNTAIFYPRDGREAREELGLPQDAQMALYVGRLDYRKGLVELIEAAAQTRASHPRLHTYLMGYGPDEQMLQEAITRVGAGDIVSIVKSQPADKVSRWMAAADLVTLPSYNEGCPNVVLEALAAGRPVVGTRVGGIPELMDDTCGRLVPVKDVAGLAQGLREVLDSQWDAEEIAARHGRSWHDVANDLEAVLENLVAGPKK